MGATSSNTKHYSNQFNSNIYSTPPKLNNKRTHNRVVQLQCDPRSPTDGISRTPIQIDSQLPAPSVKLCNHVLPHIIGPSVVISEVNNNDNQENEIRHRSQKLDITRNNIKRISDIEPTLDPSDVLAALMANNNCQLPPYQL
ncbi:unnamed protein product [Rotaria socialis]|uniref:Uncharacterized protein n=1 Tax=Rotaria socialis TaxID=392032 RepID=A0A820YK87_9BILA|nr:unnamed protein product [Rotaria socialis]CAF3325686.1 unnamed protein product [Rotaria socialis]CAF3465854.1 unnamed protein product [Rotaria socialis]CAF3486140.1 unnamed protein product [Rotaria socialis]CAF3549784.1 unnamed protein product [Rotaria socialis]